ncbi:MAG: hypothetical protein H7099_18025 [Gemmatimonadaceae bacterium]|nr:hypothetical protein [Gemmatimonadaceae bacterium]
MPSSESRRIAAALERRVGDSHDPAHVAACAIVLWREIETQLMPILGTRGVAALFGRTLYLTSRTHSWLGEVPEGVHSVMDLDSLQAAITAQPFAIGIEGAGALFVVFHDLLVSMVGAQLTERLLRDVMATPSSGHAAQEAQ